MASLKKVNKVMYNKGGNGYTYARINLPISWLEGLGITEDNRAIEVELKGKTIVIRKAEEQGDAAR